MLHLPSVGWAGGVAMRCLHGLCRPLSPALVLLPAPWTGAILLEHLWALRLFPGGHQRRRHVLLVLPAIWVVLGVGPPA